nr:MAG TPA: hypothetical protein [Caudoviricetes sp.]
MSWGNTPPGNSSYFTRNPCSAPAVNAPHER